MENNVTKKLFKLIMNNPQPALNRDLQVISLIYPITMDEISVPIRNKGCNEIRSCIWPLASLTKQFEEQAKKGTLQESNNEDFSTSYFICKMCADETKHLSAKRSYDDFYYDQKVDFLIRAAKVKYLDSFKDQLAIQTNPKKQQKAKNRIQNNFKHSKLYVHKGGGAILQYQKKVADGVKVTYRTVIFENTLSHYSEQLEFNPKDYSRNLSALKVAQNLIQRKIGDCIDNGFQEISSTYSKKYQKMLEEVLSGWVEDHIMKHTGVAKKQELYAARLFTGQIAQNRINLQLIVFYPRYNITQIYTFDDKEDIINSCNKEILQICKLPNRQILLYTADYSYIIQLKQATKNFQRIQTILKRPISVTHKHESKTYQADAKIQYIKQWDSYHKGEQNIIKFNSIRPVIESPLLLVNPPNNEQVVNPPNNEQVFIFGGSNNIVYQLQRGKQKNQVKWVQQEQAIMCNYKYAQLIIEQKQMFVLAFQACEKEKEVLYKLLLLELQILKGELRIKQISDLKKQSKNGCLLPLHSRNNEYILVDLTSKQTSYSLNLATKQISEKALRPDFIKFIKQLYDARNQRSIFNSYPNCSVTYNQITYYVLSYSLAKRTFKILYGCDDEWMVSDLSESLLHD